MGCLTALNKMWYVKTRYRIGCETRVLSTAAVQVLWRIVAVSSPVRCIVGRLQYSTMHAGMAIPWAY